MNERWIVIIELLQSAPYLAGGFLIVLSMIHPLIGGPLSIAIQTLLIGVFDSIILGSLIMWGANLIGIMLYYLIFHRFIEWIDPWIHTQKKLQALLAWSEKKAPWQHVIALGLPFIYTYPLRITLVKAQGFKRFTMMLATSYAMLVGFNLILIYTVFGSIANDLPAIVPLGIFGLLFFLVYQFKGRLDLG